MGERVLFMPEEDELESETERELKRQLELHRRTVKDIREWRARAMVDPVMALEMADTLLFKIEQRSTQAVIGNGKGS